MKRFRVGLRLMLLVVALFAVVFAWIGAINEYREIELQGQLDRLEMARKQDLLMIESMPEQNRRGYRARLAQTEVEIAKRQKLIGKTGK